MRIVRALLISLCLVIAEPAASQPYPSSVGPLAVEQVAGGFEHPWGLAFLPDGRLLVTERPGRLRYVDDGMVSEPVKGVPPVFAQGQGGLLDIALSPDFADTGLLYLGFADPVGRGEARSAVARARLAGGRLTDVEIIFQQQPAVRGGRHFGLRIVPAPDGTLFIGMGDRGLKDPAQDLDTTIGKVVRVNTDGSVPTDNPFVGRSGALPEIFSYGHRNIQGGGLDAQGRFWTVEHGPRGGDALHRPQSGANYGWPLYSEGVAYSGAALYAQEPPEGVVPPIHYWVPSIAPSGLTVYDGALFPDWQGHVIVGALRSQLIAVIEPETGAEERILEGAFGRIRDVRTGPDGAIWFLTDDPDGGVFRITPARDPS